jgi:hypothetical protein
MKINFTSMMRTAIRVFIQKVPCKRAQSPALGAPHSPATLHHLLDLQKGSLRRLNPHSWIKRETPGTHLQVALMTIQC